MARDDVRKVVKSRRKAKFCVVSLFLTALSTVSMLLRAVSNFINSLLIILVINIFQSVQGVAAFDGGDAAALILGLIIGTMGICACVGCYARKRVQAS